MNSIKSSVVACLTSIALLAVSADAVSLTVNSTADDGTGTCTASKCTLRDAILSAGFTDTVAFSVPAKSAITLTGGQLVVDKNLTITGPGANLLTVQRSAGSANFRIFNIDAAHSVTISGLTIANGIGEEGGGILNNGTLAVTNTAISGNTAGGGGGVSNQGTLTITNSTISGNSGVFGGGISNSSTLTVANSTISGNMAPSGSGGGIYNFKSLTLVNSTISGNTADANGSTGGGVSNIGGSPGGTVILRNTIIALNTVPSGTGPDISGAFTSQGFNLIGNNSGATIASTATDQIGTSGSPIDPKLDSLRDNGGPTLTHALLSGSRAIDAGNSSSYDTDQRGFARPVDSPAIANASGGDGSDIGAYEVQPDQLAGCSEINLVVNNNSDGSAGSLRSVIANACGGSTITFAANIRGVINLSSGELSINKNLTINGPGANLLTVQRSAASGTPAFRIFNIMSASIDATISGLTIANGISSSGGGISNFGKLTLINAAVSANSATNGGGIFNNFGTLALTNSTISGNTVSSNVVAGSGGGIFNSGGTLVLSSSTVSGNSANGPGRNSDSGGGIITNVGTVTLTNSTISGNSGDFGGGLRNVNGGTVRSRNSIIALNTSPSGPDPGGPDVTGPLTSQGFNLIGNSFGAIISGTQFSDQIGSAVSPIDPLLGPLQDNGGPTFTRALLFGSPAINNGDSSGLTTDQRGFIRPVGVRINYGDGCDIGAFEVQAPAVVVEFYNSSLDHYFITWVADEIAKLDDGTVIKGWMRTGQAFTTYTTPQSGTSAVCRYYIPPGLGDSHFFGRGTAECNATGQKNPSFVLEDAAFMQMFLPIDGNCPANTTQVYRVFSNRPDANHRYMTDKAIRDQMVANGWVAEGDGPDLVVMCGPR